MMNAEAVKARLNRIARETGRNMQDMLILYGLERTVYRIAVSKYMENFTLKGGIFLYALMDGNFARATTDIDLLAQNTGNDINNMEMLFRDIFSVNADDPLRYDLDSISVASITEFKEYHGVNVTVKAYLDRTRIDVSIDIGFGDVVYPERVMMEFPVMLSEKAPKIYAYSLASSIAEKFEAMVSLGYDNSRFKDFYDIYVFSGLYDFEGEVLKEAVRETFLHRKTSFDDIVIFDKGFATDQIRRSRWKAFTKKKKISLNVSLEDTLELIKVFLAPVVEAIREGKEFNRKWRHESTMWI